MDTEPKIYTEEEILGLASALEKNVESFKWLYANCKELAATADALAFKTKNAEAWLQKNNYEVLTQFVNAISYDDNSAYKFLDSYPRKEWAAVADYVSENDDEAMVWLFKSGLKYFAALADTLRRIIKAREQAENAKLGAEAAAIGALGFVAGGIIAGAAEGLEGFAGFAGGDFGGAGAGALW